MTFDPYEPFSGRDPFSFASRPDTAEREQRLRERRRLARQIRRVLLLGIVSAIAAFMLGSGLDVTHFHDTSNGFMWRWPLSIILGGVAIGCLIWLVATAVRLIRESRD
ncbi:hypothetical protein [Amycolatopsis sp. CA-126428]|uniref:hypothetical protein n=1 Tax=Amycolatopsis sp. CA-126428 TaxID=2073158 RepID=UPI000CD27B9E|nr:hypothetical protein [Amycolatopsis sp. CA-126428]